MSPTSSEPEEAITEGEIAQQSPAPAPGNPTSSSRTGTDAKPRNAFTELMKPKPKPPLGPDSRHSHASTASSKLIRAFRDRDGLGAYLADPKAFPSSRVIYHNEGFVAIHDLYPKASVHTLLLPRSTQHNRLHPFDAFEDADFLAAVRAETDRLRGLVAKELKRRFGSGSRREMEREKKASALAAAGEDEEEARLPPGRDWLAEVKVGIHMHPSMNHLHVHVMSRDMHSPCMKHRKHYNSFNTPFLVDLADFPLPRADPRRRGNQQYLDRNLVCWRCGKDFGNGFKALKEHLEKEFEAWKAE